MEPNKPLPNNQKPIPQKPIPKPLIPNKPDSSTSIPSHLFLLIFVVVAIIITSIILFIKQFNIPESTQDERCLQACSGMPHCGELCKCTIDNSRCIEICGKDEDCQNTCSDWRCIANYVFSEDAEFLKRIDEIPEDSILNEILEQKGKEELLKIGKELNTQRWCLAAIEKIKYPDSCLVVKDYCIKDYCSNKWTGEDCVNNCNYSYARCNEIR